MFGCSLRCLFFPSLTPSLLSFFVDYLRISLHSLNHTHFPVLQWLSCQKSDLCGLYIQWSMVNSQGAIPFKQNPSPPEHLPGPIKCVELNWTLTRTCQCVEVNFIILIAVLRDLFVGFLYNLLFEDVSKLWGRGCQRSLLCPPFHNWVSSHLCPLQKHPPSPSHMERFSLSLDTRGFA